MERHPAASRRVQRVLAGNVWWSGTHNPNGFRVEVVTESVSVQSGARSCLVWPSLSLCAPVGHMSQSARRVVAANEFSALAVKRVGCHTRLRESGPRSTRDNVVMIPA